MSNYQLISDYRHIQQYKKSFYELAKSTFGIDFKEWDERGGWNDRYICYSYVDEEQIIANASISKMNIVIHQKEYHAIQIGTVMTHPDYRNQGLSGKLMNHILAKYEHQCDFIYLFANASVLDFYPRFGFKRMQESSFTLKTSLLRTSQTSSVRVLDTNNPDDFLIIQRIAGNRAPVSSTLGVTNAEGLLLFYVLVVFNDSIYYIEEDDVIVLFKKDDHQLHLFDIISTSRFDLYSIINSILSPEVSVIHCHFTPDDPKNLIEAGFTTQNDDTLFVRPFIKDLPNHFMFPITSHA